MSVHKEKLWNLKFYSRKPSSYFAVFYVILIVLRSSSWQTLRKPCVMDINLGRSSTLRILHSFTYFREKFSIDLIKLYEKSFIKELPVIIHNFQNPQILSEITIYRLVSKTKSIKVRNKLLFFTFFLLKYQMD